MINNIRENFIKNIDIIRNDLINKNIVINI